MKMTIDDLAAMSPCADGLAFARKCGSLKRAWATCREPSWLFWFAQRTKIIDKPQAIELAVAFAERVLPLYERKYPDDLRPRKALEAAKKWLKAPTEENRTAAASADACAATAYAVADAANADDAAYAAAKNEEKKWQCDKIREVLGNPFLPRRKVSESDIRPA
jgi:hypothetical protein